MLCSICMYRNGGNSLKKPKTYVGGQAVMVLTVDASPGAEVLAGIAAEIEAGQVESVDLV